MSVIRFTLQQSLDDLPSELYGKQKFSRDYWEWEKQAELELRHRGFTQVSWSTSEGDSFGPLVRKVVARYFNESAFQKAFYG